MPTENTSTKAKAGSKSLTSRLGLARKSISQPSTSKAQVPLSSPYNKAHYPQSSLAPPPPSLSASASSNESSAQYSPSQETIVELPMQHTSHYPLSVVRALHPTLALDISRGTTPRSSVYSQTDDAKSSCVSIETESRRSSFVRIVEALNQGLLLDLPEMHSSRPVSPMPMPSPTSQHHADQAVTYKSSTFDTSYDSSDLQRTTSASSAADPIAPSWIDGLNSLSRARSMSSTFSASLNMSRDEDETMSQDFITRLPVALDTESISSAPWMHSEQKVAEAEDVDVMINTRAHSRVLSPSGRRSYKGAPGVDPPIASYSRSSQSHLVTASGSHDRRPIQPRPSLDSLASIESYPRKAAKGKSLAAATLSMNRPPRSLARSKNPSKSSLRGEGRTVDTCLADEIDEADIQWEMLNDATAAIKEYQRLSGIVSVQYSDKFGAIERWRTDARESSATVATLGEALHLENADETIQAFQPNSPSTASEPAYTTSARLTSATSERGITAADSFQSMSSMAPSLFTALSGSPTSTPLANNGRSFSSLGFTSGVSTPGTVSRVQPWSVDQHDNGELPGAFPPVMTSPTFEIKASPTVKDTPSAIRSPGTTVKSDPNSEAFESADEGTANATSLYAYSPAQRIRAEVLARQRSAQKRVSMQLALNDRIGSSIRSPLKQENIQQQQSTFDLTKDQLLALSEELEAGNVDTMELQRRCYKEGACCTGDASPSECIPTPDLSRESCISEKEEDMILTPQTNLWQISPRSIKDKSPASSKSPEVNVIESEFKAASEGIALVPPPTIPVRRRSRRSETTTTKDETEVSKKRLRAPSFLKLDILPIQLVEPPTQTSWRMNQSKEAFEEFSTTFGSKEMHRQEVIEELRVTEMNFVVNLNAILRIFSLPLREKGNNSMAFRQDVPIDVARLFNCLDDILSFHAKILRTLDKVKNRHPSTLVVSIAGAFHRHVTGLAVYQSYLVNFERVTNLIEDIRHNPIKAELVEFDNIIQRQSALPECRGLSLSSFLLKPVQRLMKYPLFFKQLAELTPADHPDYRDTIQLCNMTEKIIRDMNCVKAREEDYQELKLLQERIKGLPEGFILASRQRRLLKQGPLYSSSLTGMDKRTDAQYVLQQSTSSDSSHTSISPNLKSLELTATVNNRTMTPPVPPRQGLLLLSPDMSRQSSQLSTPSSSTPWCNSPAESFGESGSYLETKSVSNLSITSMQSSMKPSDLKTKQQQQAPPPRPASRKTNKGGLFSKAQSYNKLMMANVEVLDDETNLYAFLFDDLLLLTTMEKEIGKSKSSSIGRKRGATIGKSQSTSPILPQVGDEPCKYNLVSHGGISRIIGVTSRSAKGDLSAPVSALEVEVLPLHLVGQKLRNSSGAGSLTFLFTFAEDTKHQVSSTASHEPCQQWEKQMERSFMHCVQSRKRDSMMVHADMASPLFAAVLPPQPKPAPAQVEWLQRRDKVTSMVMNAATCGDRTTLVALLQAGLPFPRSPSQQNLSDLANHTVSMVKRGPSKRTLTVSSSEQLKEVSIENPTTRSLRKIPSQSQLQNSNRRSPNSVSSTIPFRESMNLEEITQIGDLGTPNDVAQILYEEKKEEKTWWKLRLKEIEIETNWNLELEKVMGTRRSRIAMTEMEAASSSSSISSRPKLPVNKYGSFNTKVRKGIPVHRY